MSNYTIPGARDTRPGIALISVLYFLVVCGLSITAVTFAQHSAAKNTLAFANGARLIAAADAAIHQSLAQWDTEARIRQAIGSTISAADQTDAGIATSTYLTRLSTRVFSIVAESRVSSNGASRRLSLLVRLPIEASPVTGALISAANVSIGPEVRFLADTGSCADTTSAAIVLAPDASVNVDSAMPAGAQPSVRRDSAAADSATYLRRSDAWWIDLARRADIRLEASARVAPTPTVSGAECRADDSNWGDPQTRDSPCAARAPLVYAPGDLTIDSGVGQGVLLVDGHLTIAGPFLYSGQIVARRGIETLADNIQISGAVYAWRASVDTTGSSVHSSDVVLTHATTIRHSRCDLQHGVPSWLEPRRVRERAWAEVFE